MDNNSIDGAVHEISMMVLVLLDAVETLRGTATSPRAFQMPYEAGEMLSFAASISTAGESPEGGDQMRLIRLLLMRSRL